MTSATITRPAAARGAHGAARPAFRRLLVTIGVAGSLLVAGVTIRAAAQWAAVQAPLTVAPVSVESVQRALEAEQSRSAELQAQLAALQGSTSELSSALAEAQARADTDQATAEELRASLTAAQDKLTKLEAALAAAAKKAATTRTTTVSSGSGTRAGGSDDGGFEPNDD
jgi:septal ring factor EnvC (AmiA/AmiB activator)